jgi:putative membrane protein
VALLGASACTRFGVFEAGMRSAEDPKHTVVPQRRRLEAEGRTNGQGGDDPMKRHLTTIAAATLALAGTAACPACSAGEATHSANTTTSSPAVPKGDRAWLASVHQANLAEIEVGELARKKGGTPAVRAAGAMLVTDHTASDKQVAQVARDLNVTLPGSAAPADAATASRLGNESGGQFDHDFVAAMRTGHEKAIALTRTEIGKGSVPQVKTLARSTLPVLRKHLNMLRQAATTG